MLKKIALAFAVLITLTGAVSTFVAMAHAQATVPWGECTTNYYGHGPC